MVECIRIKDHGSVATLDELHESSTGGLAPPETGSYSYGIIEREILTGAGEALRRVILSDQRLRYGEMPHRIRSGREMNGQVPRPGTHRSSCCEDRGAHHPLRSGDEERPTIVVLIGEALPGAEGTLHISVLEEVVLHIAREGVVIQSDTEDFPVSHKCRILPQEKSQLGRVKGVSHTGVDDSLRVIVSIVLSTETGWHIERDDKGALLIDEATDIGKAPGKATTLLRAADPIDDDRPMIHLGRDKIPTHLTQYQSRLKGSGLGPGDHLRQHPRATVIEQGDIGSMTQHIERDCREQCHGSRHTRTGKDDQVLPRPQLPLQLGHESIGKPLRQLMLIQGAYALHSTGQQSLSGLIVEYLKHSLLSPEVGVLLIT